MRGMEGMKEGKGEDVHLSLQTKLALAQGPAPAARRNRRRVMVQRCASLARVPHAPCATPVIADHAAHA
eukprot:7441754-Pyramimonas_sp.AAC.1